MMIRKSLYIFSFFIKIRWFMDRNLAMEFVRATEAAALSSARYMGRGDEKAADKAAVNAMRNMFSSISIRGTIVIGEGERDKAPMLYIGEKVGSGSGMEVDIAVDPLEGTTITAKGTNNAITVLASAPKGHLFHAPDLYMDKIAVSKEAKGVIDLDASVKENIHAVAGKLDKKPEDITVIILERDRHKKLIEEVRKCNARIKLIGDGDIAGGIAPSIPDSGVDMLMGIGAAPEGVITAAALKTLDGDFQGRLKPRNDEEIKRAKKMGVKDVNKKLIIKDLVKGDKAMFAATGVTDGTILKGVRFKGNGAVTHSIVMRSKTKTIRFIEAHHNLSFKPLKF
jgi:fructose-1,6-bisphosphatase II